MKKYNIYFGLLFSIVCSLLLFSPKSVFAVFQLPDPSTCYLDTSNHVSNELDYFYFVVSQEKILDPVGGLEISKISNKVKCIQLPIRTLSIDVDVILNLLPIELQSSFAANDLTVQWFLRPSKNVPKTFVDRGGITVKTREASDPTSVDYIIHTTNRIPDCNIESKLDEELTVNSLLNSAFLELITYHGECTQYYKFIRHVNFGATPTYVYYLGSSSNKNFGPPGDVTWGGDTITISKGQPSTYTMGVTTNVSDLDLGISCLNCAEINVIKTDIAGKQAVLLNIDPTKLKGYTIQLSARTPGVPYFESRHDVKIVVADIECSTLDVNSCNTNAYCFWYPAYSTDNKCIAKTLQLDCSKVPQALCGTKEGSSYCTWLEKTGAGTAVCTDSLSSSYQASYGQTNYTGPLPPCAFDGSCRNINDLLQLAINIGTYMLGLIGSVALLFFVYGGLMMILSMGNAERVKKGRDILVAAIVGIVIAFSAYALINFVLDALNVSKEFRVIEQIK
ncbi:MAG: hypothetical protein COU32_01550 [Candidatus Magasanikbacteria bacterium CG10_big_fil_rev_8_21_14_0_10_42_10]|uniref:Uncharacterized protein n=2 Tax=Candidatus Magasanikiibacteriota TaxID=1752731 RepID=A0A2H0TWI4_9BACT|nr:MAG: hypothetical protein COU32_01550 [Candidatus Magasanikbacteria bacterium CG10_big_fil_rev_8_21_14_0_10_42_10]PIZ94042.1 MAG: hypothetical protein COX82_01460 [Candidatus Magasanikbacteria bacterium CG_4_10_14_0_2_um_filter_41_10]